MCCSLSLNKGEIFLENTRSGGICQEKHPLSEGLFMVDFRITLTHCIGEVKNLAYRDRSAFRVGDPPPTKLSIYF